MVEYQSMERIGHRDPQDPDYLISKLPGREQGVFTHRVVSRLSTAGEVTFHVVVDSDQGQGDDIELAKFQKGQVVHESLTTGTKYIHVHEGINGTYPYQPIPHSLKSVLIPVRIETEIK